VLYSWLSVEAVVFIRLTGIHVVLAVLVTSLRYQLYLPELLLPCVYGRIITIITVIKSVLNNVRACTGQTLPEDATAPTSTILCIDAFHRLDTQSVFSFCFISPNHLGLPPPHIFRNINRNIQAVQQL